jgi:hypothetical protein
MGDVYRATVDCGNGTVTDTVTGLIWLKQSGTFIFRVDPIAPPGAPGGFSATPGNGQVTLTWAAASGATGYKIRRGTTSSGPYTVVKSNIVGTTFTDTGLTNGTAYF